MLTGCWDRLEIEERAVVLAIAVDAATPSGLEEESEVTSVKNSFPEPAGIGYQITAQIAVPGRIPLGPSNEGGGGGSSPVWVLSACGHTLDDAISVMQQQLADKLFLGHLRVIIVSEKVARKGLEDLNDYLRRNTEVRRLAWLSVSKGRAEKLVRASPQLERVPGLYLLAMFDHAVEMGKYPEEFIGMFWSKSTSKGVEPILPLLNMNKEGSIEIAGLAYFIKDKMVGKTKQLEIGFYMAVTGKKQGGYTAFIPRHPGSNEMVMIRIMRRKTTTQVSMKNGKPQVRVHVSLEENIEENPNEKFRIDKEENLEELAKTSADMGVKGYNELIKNLQLAGSDIFGFGEQFRAKMPGYWNRNIRTDEKWTEVFRTLSVDIQCEVHIRRVGMKAS
ncbi:Ger(x)C family spore germination protein [Paenibacillus sepulcri]|uniref:Ger(X)C family spore germination protein n=1 Tax=Paenibacillus sepulcri TaxID=359917 RepID=A0ABS7C3S5_9BACL|nr:Ger(x)C family spore germination protein [Paenibacillus sepulcri]